MTAKKKVKRAVRLSRVSPAIREHAKAVREVERIRVLGNTIADRIVTHLKPRQEPNQEARWHGAHAALQALMHAGAIKEQYVLFIREHLAMRREAVFQINGIAILPPDVPR